MSPRMGLNLQTVLQTAAELADKNGLDEVTLSSLARRLDIRPPSLYNHVDGLQGLRKKLAVYGIKQLNQTMTLAAVGKTKDDALHSIAQSYIEFVRVHPGLYDATVRAVDFNESEAQMAGKEAVQLLLRVLNAYGLEGDTAVHLIRGLHGLLHGFASLEQSKGFNIPIDPNESLHLSMDVFIKGIHSMMEKN